LEEELGRSLEDREMLVETGWSKAKDIRRAGGAKRKIENITIAEYMLQYRSYAIHGE
jgi:hypothetical protein